MNSVEAQRCRQLLDLIIGFRLSPLLWRHIQTSQKGLSAGRVQSTLLRMLQDHENTIKNYEPSSHMILKGLYMMKTTNLNWLTVNSTYQMIILMMILTLNVF